MGIWVMFYTRDVGVLEQRPLESFRLENLEGSSSAKATVIPVPKCHVHCPD